MKDICICPICGQKNLVNNEKTICINCKNSIDLKICKYQKKKNDSLEKRKHDLYMALLNDDDKYINNFIYDLIIECPNDLLINYIYIYMLKHEDSLRVEEFFRNKNFECTKEEKTKVIYHLLEHYNLYNKNLLIEFINYYAEEKKENMIQIIENKGLLNERALENEFRLTLFFETIIPLSDIPSSKRRKQGIISLIFSTMAFIILYVFLLFLTKEDVVYSSSILYMILPIILLTRGATKVIFKKSRWYISLFLFILLFYIITYLITLSYNHYEFMEGLLKHGLNIVKAPYDYVMIIIERMKTQWQ